MSFSLRPSAPVCGPFLSPGVNTPGRQKSGSDSRPAAQNITICYLPRQDCRKTRAPVIRPAPWELVCGYKPVSFYPGLISARFPANHLESRESRDDFCKKSFKSCESREPKVVSLIVVRVVLVLGSFAFDTATLTSRNHVVCQSRQAMFPLHILLGQPYLM